MRSFLDNVSLFERRHATLHLLWLGLCQLFPTGALSSEILEAIYHASLTLLTNKFVPLPRYSHLPGLYPQGLETQSRPFPFFNVPFPIFASRGCYSLPIVGMVGTRYGGSEPSIPNTLHPPPHLFNGTIVRDLFLASSNAVTETPAPLIFNDCHPPLFSIIVLF